MAESDVEVLADLQAASAILEKEAQGVSDVSSSSKSQPDAQLTTDEPGLGGPIPASEVDQTDAIIDDINNIRNRIVELEDLGDKGNHTPQKPSPKPSTAAEGSSLGETPKKSNVTGEGYDDAADKNDASVLTFDDSSMEMSQITGIDDGSVVASIEGAPSVDGGGSIEGGESILTPNTGISTKSSKKRDPSDPTKYNAVTVHLCYASGIRQWDASCDPFALVTVGFIKTTFEEKLSHLENTGYHDSLYETRVLENTSEPEWNEVCTIAFPVSEDLEERKKMEVHIQIQDKDMSSDDDLGEARIRLTKFVCDDEEKPTEAELPLGGPGAGDDDPCIFIKFNFTNVEDYPEGSTVSGSMVSEQNLEVENRKELLHPGEWVKEVRELGRLKPWTRYWTCCGSDKHLSMYCTSLGDRVEFAHNLVAHNEYLRLKPIKEAKAKEMRDKWLEEKKKMKDAKVKRDILMAENNVEDPLNELEKKHFFMSKEWKIKKGIWREVKTDTFNEAHGADENDLYEHRMGMVKPADISMVVGTMRKNMDNHWMITQGMDILQRLLDQKDAQKKCIQFGALVQILKGLKVHAATYDIQILGIKALRKYCQYPPTQEKAMLNMDVTNMGITRLKLFRDKEEMVEECMEILKFTCNLRKNRARIFDTGCITQVTLAVVGYKHNTKILCAAFLLLEILGGMQKGREEILVRGLVKIALSVMQKYQDNGNVLAAAMGMLLLACEEDRGLVQMISSNGVATTLYALKHLVNKAELQQRGLEFFHKLAGTTKGAQILDGIKGSWQWLAQGTEGGNALVHLQPGPWQSKGWAMGDINELDVMNKGILYLNGATGARSKSKSMWSASSLKKFMGLSQKETKMELNNAEHEFYFSVIRDLGLLPRNDEQREYWFQRVKAFEEKNGINVDELVERNQIRKFGGVLHEDRGDEDKDEEGGEVTEEKKDSKPPVHPGRSHGGGPMAYKQVKRKAAKGTKGRKPPPPVVIEKVYEKRAVFLEGHKSSGWVSGDSTWNDKHGFDLDEGVRDGKAARVIHSRGGSRGSGGGSRGGNRGSAGGDGDGGGDGDESDGRGNGDYEETYDTYDTYDDDYNYNDDGDDDDDDYDDGFHGTYDEDDDSSMASSQISFADDGNYSKRTKTKKVIKHSHKGKVLRKSKLKIAKDIANRLPEKRRDIFHTKDRHGNLYIPPPIEKLFPEVIGTGMATAKYRTQDFQFSFVEDPYRFGKTKEEIAAMDALMDL